MRIEEVEKFFKNGAKACQAIGIGRCNISKWKKLHGGVVPKQFAIDFHIASNGQLRLGLEDYPLTKPHRQAA